MSFLTLVLFVVLWSTIGFFCWKQVKKYQNAELSRRLWSGRSAGDEVGIPGEGHHK